MSSLDLAPISLLRLNVKIFLDSILIIHKVIHMLNLLKVRYTVSVIRTSVSSCQKNNRISVTDSCLAHCFSSIISYDDP